MLPVQGEVSQLAAFSLATKPVTIVAVLKSATESFLIVVSPARGAAPGAMAMAMAAPSKIRSGRFGTWHPPSGACTLAPR